MHREERSLTLTWLALVALTLLSVAIAEMSGLRAAMYVAVFGVAIIKGQIVAARFMETRRARPVWRGLYHIWILLIGLALLAGNIFAPEAAPTRVAAETIAKP